jgi:hypothetical protein
MWCWWLVNDLSGQVIVRGIFRNEHHGAWKITTEPAEQFDVGVCEVLRSQDVLSKRTLRQEMLKEGRQGLEAADLGQAPIFELLAQNRARRCMHIGVEEPESRRAVFADTEVGDRLVV